MAHYRAGYRQRYHTKMSPGLGQQRYSIYMSKPVRKRPRRIVLVLAFGIATLVALVLAEVVLQIWVSPTKPVGGIGFETAAGVPVAGAQQAIEMKLIVEVPPKIRPRWRTMFRSDQGFFITYEDNDVLKRDWFDEQGRVLNHINASGIRERAKITHEKPAGQRRIVCIGDSFTFGWGIRPEDGWVRMLEDDLRKDKGDVRTVNCGASGTVCVDEYWYGLKHRFHKFEPDAVIMTLCLNDLVGSHGLSFIVPINTGVKLLDLAKGALGYHPLDLNPDDNWAQWLLDLPEKEGLALGLYNPDRPFEAMWSQEVPQESMRAAKAWCDKRKIPFMVVIWPFLQGLGPGKYYPFQKLHDLVAADCEAAGIPLLDVLPALKDTPQEDLWVTPADPHPNPFAQCLTLPRIAEFVRSHIDW